jgi:purine-binding chemotaxis protein CheW
MVRSQTTHRSVPPETLIRSPRDPGDGWEHGLPFWRRIPGGGQPHLDRCAANPPQVAGAASRFAIRVVAKHVALREDTRGQRLWGETQARDPMSSSGQTQLFSGVVAESEARVTALICRVRCRFCALPLPHVSETMRPLPVEPLTRPLPFVNGIAIIRGAPVPVIDPGSLLGTDEAPRPTRFVTLAVDGRHLALAVEGVVGIRDLPAADLEALSPLLRDVGTEFISAVGVLDAALLIVLRSTRILSDATWNALAASKESS